MFSLSTFNTTIFFLHVIRVTLDILLHLKTQLYYQRGMIEYKIKSMLDALGMQ